MERFLHHRTYRTDEGIQKTVVNLYLASNNILKKNTISKS